MREAPSPSDPAPRVLTVVVNWNGREVLRACLRSLEGVTYPNQRVVVVDNASTDGSPDLVREEFSWAELLQSERNLLFAGGNNLALRRGLGRGFDLFLLLNNDTEVAPDFLDHLVAAARRHPASGVFGPRIFYAEDPTLIWYAGGRVGRWTGTIEHAGLRERAVERKDMEGPTDYVTGCALLVRREVLLEVGLLDEGYVMYAEDVDLCLRARRAGYGCTYVPGSRVWHKISASSGGGLTEYKLYHRIASTLRLVRRHFPPYTWPTVLACQALRTVRFLVLQLLRGRMGMIRAVLGGLGDGIRGRRRG